MTRTGMTDHLIVLDAEWLAAPGCMPRMWCGPDDPDPVVVQIGAVKLGLWDDFPIVDRVNIFVQPRDRTGKTIALDPWFADFTGLTDAQLAQEGLSLADALTHFAAFAGDDPIYSWGKDEMMLMGISPYLAGLTPPLPARQFGHAAHLLERAGYSAAELIPVRSNTLLAFLGLPAPERHAHDGLADATEVALALQHLLRTKALPVVAIATSRFGAGSRTAEPPRSGHP